MAIGWFLSGYGYSNAYGGWFISDYGNPVWVGVDNGSWNTCNFITSNNIGSQSVSYATSAGSATSATVASKIWDPDYHDYSHRRTSANINYADGALHYYLATSTMTTGKPSSDAHILHMAWDNGSWEGQLALPTSGSMQWRTMGGGTWTSWYTILDSSNYTSYCATSGHNHDSRYVLKSGDTMTGNLNMGNHVLSGCDSVRLNDTSDDWTEGFMIPRSNGNWDSIYAVDGTFYLAANNGTLKDLANLGSKSANLKYVYTNLLHPGSGNNLWLTSDQSIFLCPSGASTNTNNCVVVGAGYINIKYSTSATMTYGTSNPRLIFSENGSQAVGIVYTDYDSYRASKGLKVMDVDNNDTGNVWLEVQGSCYAPSFYTTSDRTKKTNIKTLSEHIRKFTLKETNKDAYGVIAQEVPEMFRDGEEGNMTVNYNSVLSYYIGLLENKVKNLEETNKKLLEFIEKTYGKII